MDVFVCEQGSSYHHVCGCLCANRVPPIIMFVDVCVRTGFLLSSCLWMSVCEQGSSYLHVCGCLCVRTGFLLSSCLWMSLCANRVPPIFMFVDVCVRTGFLLSSCCSSHKSHIASLHSHSCCHNPCLPIVRSLPTLSDPTFALSVVCRTTLHQRMMENAVVARPIPSS